MKRTYHYMKLDQVALQLVVLEAISRLRISQWRVYVFVLKSCEGYVCVCQS